ncbi:uncharacterized protein LOC130670065 [Microplitis mediator]|uniref:uncharacterized protein LOC130670065 n=1 Tax=Microplitis mediator TaxID=375433 RepID=UPI00255251A3|nr:uncharacterized protein LOC130670065 [Microplitis mediator]
MPNPEPIPLILQTNCHEKTVTFLDNNNVENTKNIRVTSNITISPIDLKMFKVSQSSTPKIKLEMYQRKVSSAHHVSQSSCDYAMADDISTVIPSINHNDERIMTRIRSCKNNKKVSADETSLTENEIEESGDDSDKSYKATESDNESIENESELCEDQSEDENGDNDLHNSNLPPRVSQGSQNTSSSLINSFNMPGNSGWDDNDVIAELTCNKGNSKKDFCIFCKEEILKIARHFEIKHRDEPEVQSFLDLKKKSAERRRAIGMLRKKGNFEFNKKQTYNHKDHKPGVIKVVRCPNQESKQSGGNFAPCSNCKGWYTKNNLRHHYPACKGNAANSKGILAKARKLQGQIHQRASKDMRYKILPAMKLKNHVRLIRYDLLIILFGNEECMKYKKRNLAQMIRGKLSLIARFFTVVKRKEPTVSDFASIFDPIKYHAVIDAINEFAGLDEESGYYQVPSRASEITTNINKMGQIYISECIINNEDEKKQKVENFLLLCKQGFANIINRTVMETRIMQQRQKVIELPRTDDIQRLSEYLDKKISKNRKKLKTNFSKLVWRDLAEALLAQLQLFNRKRAGELERFEIQDYEKMTFITEKDEGYELLSESDKKAAKEYGRATICGKLHKNVPLLLNSKVRKGLIELLKFRTEAGYCFKKIFGRMWS